MIDQVARGLAELSMRVQFTAPEDLVQGERVGRPPEALAFRARREQGVAYCRDCLFRIDIEQIDEQGDGFLLALRFRGTGLRSGVKVDLKFANAIRIRDGLQVEIISRRTADEAREALQGSKQAPRGQTPGRGATLAPRSPDS